MAGKVICYHQLPSDSVTVSTSVHSAYIQTKADIQISEIESRRVMTEVMGSSDTESLVRINNNTGEPGLESHGDQVRVWRVRVRSLK